MVSPSLFLVKVGKAGGQKWKAMSQAVSIFETSLSDTVRKIV